MTVAAAAAAAFCGFLRKADLHLLQLQNISRERPGVRLMHACKVAAAAVAAAVAVAVVAKVARV